MSLGQLYAAVHQPAEPVPVAAPIAYALGVVMAQEAMNALWGSPALAGELLVIDTASLFFGRETLAR